MLLLKLLNKRLFPRDREVDEQGLSRKPGNLREKSGRGPNATAALTAFHRQDFLACDGSSRSISP